MNITGCLKKDSAFFDQAKPVNSNISILLSPESSLTYDRRSKGSLHTMAAMSCYQALAERGIAVKLEQTQDFQWNKSSGKAVILAEMITISDVLVDSIKAFLNHGNKIIILGPSGYYNEFEDCQFLNFPFKNEFGAEPKEIQTIGDRIKISSIDGNYRFDANKILGTIKNYSATPICMDKGEITGIRNKTVNSEVVWIPSDIDIGAWMYGNQVLSKWLADELTAYSATQPFSFAYKTNNVVMQTMHDGQNWLTVITNGSETVNKVQLMNKLNKKATIIYCTNTSRKMINTKDEIQLSPKECLVIMWKYQ